MKNQGIGIRWKAAALGTGVAAIAMVVLSAAAAAVLAGEGIGMEQMGYLAAAVLIGSAFLGSLTAAVSGGPSEGVAAAVGELVVLFALNLLLSGGEMEGIGVTALALAGGCGAAVLLTMNRGRNHRRRRRKNR